MDCSDEHSVPLSKVLPVRMSRTAFGTSAVRSMYVGTFPGPTPNAGLPALYAALTIAEPPVARMRAVRGCFIRVSVPSRVDDVRQEITPRGAPARSAASASRRLVSRMHFAAEGCGLKTMAFRPLRAIKAL